MYVPNVESSMISTAARSPAGHVSVEPREVFFQSWDRIRRAISPLPGGHLG
jgi:hypothetical protein